MLLELKLLGRILSRLSIIWAMSYCLMILLSPGLIFIE